MRIGIYDPYLDDIGGGERYIVTLASALSSDNEVSFYWGNPSDLEKVSERFLIDTSKIAIKENIFATGLVNKLIKTRNTDAIVFLSDGSFPWVLSKKLFLHIQQPLPIKKTSILEKIKSKKISAIICNSYFTKSYIDKAFPEQKTIVIYPPVSLVGPGKKKENVIFHVGRFRLIKGRDDDYKKQAFMISAFKDLVKEGLSGWRFVLAVSVNDDKDENFLKLKESAKGFPIDFLVNYNKDKLWHEGSKAKIYWHATGFGEDLVAHPELAEHFGISTVEAMSAGAVPVVINSGGQKEIIENGKNGILWNTEEELKNETLKLVEDEKKRELLSKEAMKRANDFSEEKFREEVRRTILL